MEEVAGHVQIGAQLLGRADAGPRPGRLRGARGPASLLRQKPDGTLLAVVPIPGTGTSMAIVGYPVTAPGAMQRPAAAAARTRRSGLRACGWACCSTTISAGSGWTGPRSR